jgi:L-histidine Nalpha-methyltransferase
VHTSGGRFGLKDATPHYNPPAVQRFSLIDRDTVSNDFAADVRRGLMAEPKVLLPQYFYDALGSALFDAITNLPEYYPTRCETEILGTYAREISSAFGGPIRLIELGSGTSRKTRLLLDAVCAHQPELEYVPVDVDREMLEKTGDDLLYEYPQLRVTAICADFKQPSRALAGVVRNDLRNVVLFLGSTIGNLTFDEAVTMLRDLRDVLSPGNLFFLGADLRKPKAILEPAYDDPLGVTAAFNRNLLLRMNRELGANFDLRNFVHRAFYDEERGRIEMHLVSTSEQTVRICEDDVHFAAGETIHTENSYKYDGPSLERLAGAAGFTIERTWTDSKGWFADVLLRV